MVIDLLNKEKNKILNFVSSCRQIYIYGAGNYGKGYLDILQHYGQDVAGFIVTNKCDNRCKGIPIYSVHEISEVISAEDGIIPAYTNSKVQDIEDKFANVIPRILDFDHKAMICMENEIHFFPLMDKLTSEFQKPNKIIDISKWNNILIVRLDAIGDTVFTTPFIREVRKNFPYSHISVVIRKQNQKILENCPYIDELFLYESELLDGELAEQCQNYQEISRKIQGFTEQNFKSKEFDVVFFPRELLCGRNTVDELLLAYYSHAKYRVGRMLADELDQCLIYEKLKDNFTLITKPSEPMHEAAYALDMLKQCGCIVEDERMELWPSIQSEQKIEDLLKKYYIEENNILIALGIEASVDTRTWRVENYNKVIRYYGETSGNRVRFIIMGGADAKEAAGKIDNSCKNVINLAGETNLDETAACMKKCDLYVGSNTGLLHFASALGIPSVTIYSELSDGKPTDGDSPVRMGAWKVPHIDLVPSAGLDGCYGVCKMSFSHCINQISPRQVINSIAQMIPQDSKNPYKYLFPYEKVPIHSRIIIYGAGTLGQDYIKQMQLTHYCEVVAIADKNYSQYPSMMVRVIPPNRIHEYDFDYIVVALRMAAAFNEVKRVLEQEGVLEEKIVCIFERKKYLEPIFRKRTLEINPVSDRLACSITNRSVAILATGGFGDMVIQKRFVMELIRLSPECKIDFYNIKAIELLKYLYSDCPNVNRVIADLGTRYLENYKKYSFAMTIEACHFIKVDQWMKENFKAEKDAQYQEFVRCIDKLIEETDKEDADISTPVHLTMTRRLYQGLNAYSGFNYYGAFNIRDKRVSIPLDKKWEITFKKLGLGRYITVNLGNGDCSDGSRIAKSWSKDKFERFIVLFKKKYPAINVVQLGDEKSEKLHGVNYQILGSDFRPAFYLLKNSIVHIDIEGGLVHIATQLGTKCVVLFGPTIKEYYGYEQNINIQAGGCHNCWGLYSDVNRCARSMEEPECMYSITPELVMGYVDEYMYTVDKEKEQHNDR